MFHLIRQKNNYMINTNVRHCNPFKTINKIDSCDVVQNEKSQDIVALFSLDQLGTRPIDAGILIFQSAAQLKNYAKRRPGKNLLIFTTEENVGEILDESKRHPLRRASIYAPGAIASGKNLRAVKNTAKNSCVVTSKTKNTERYLACTKYDTENPFQHISQLVKFFAKEERFSVERLQHILKTTFKNHPELLPQAVSAANYWFEKCQPENSGKHIGDFDIIVRSNKEVAEIIKHMKDHPEIHRLIIHTSPKGTGKTELAKEMAEFLGHTSTLLPRKNLVAKAVTDFGSAHYHDVINQRVDIDDTFSVSACIPSIGRVKGVIQKSNHLFFDEVTQSIGMVANGTICGSDDRVGKANKKEIIEDLLACCHTATTITLADADIVRNWDTVNELIDAIRDVKKAAGVDLEVIHIHLENEHTLPSVNLVEKDALLDQMVANVEAGEKIYVAVDTVDNGRYLSAKLGEYTDRVLFLHAKDKTKAQHEAQEAFIADPDAVCGNYDVVIASPVITSGANIMTEFDQVFGVYTGHTVNGSTFLQMLHRVRKASSFTMAVDTVFSHSSVAYFEYLRELFEASEERDPRSRILEVAKLDAQKQMLHPAGTLFDQLILDGYQVNDQRDLNPGSQNKLFSEELASFKKSYYQERAKAALQADRMSHAEFEKLSVKANSSFIDSAEQAMVDRYQIEVATKMAMEDVANLFGYNNESKIDAIIAGIKGKYKNIQKLIGILKTADDELVRRNLLQSKKRLSSDVAHHDRLKAMYVTIFRAFGVFDGHRFQFSGKHRDVDFAISLLQQIESYEDVINTELRPGFTFNLDRLSPKKAFEWLAKLLGCIGLELDSIRPAAESDGVRRRYYLISRRSIDRLNRLFAAFEEPELDLHLQFPPARKAFGCDELPLPEQPASGEIEEIPF